MTFKELKKFVKIEDKRLKKYFPNLADPEKIALARTVKLSEEVGELAAEVLAYHGWQRSAKLVNRQEPNLAHEFADVIITTMLIAEEIGIDVELALADKIAKINRRYKDKK